MSETVPRPCAATARARRRAAFVDAARAAFFAHGYAGTTMSSIAASVGGSKTTLWAHFPTKEALFAAVVADIVDHYAPVLSAPLPLDDDVESVLRRYGEILLETLLAPPILALHRLVAGEASRFPHLARVFYEKGPKPGKERLQRYFEALMARGTLRRAEGAHIAVQQFAGLCQAGRYQFAVLGLDDLPPEDRELECAVAVFLRYWRDDGASR